MFNPRSLLRRKSTRVGLLLTAVLLALWLCRRAYSVSPEQSMLNQTVKALEVGDTKTLCQLADKEEVDRLGLNPDNVHAFLQNTLWKDGFQRLEVGASDKDADSSADQSVWRTHPTRKGKTSLTIVLLENQDGSYHLVLSQILWGSCWYRWGRVDAGVNYVALIQQYGIAGLRNPHGKYVDIVEFAKDVAWIKKQATDPDKH